jgi:UDP-glucose 4-epimerase
VLARHATPGMHEGMVFHRGCQSDVAVVTPLFKRCDVVVHLAAATTPGRSARAPTLDAAENLVPLAGFLEALVAAGSRRIIFLSSGGAIYGNPLGLPVTEDHPAQPLSYHAAGKVAAEAFLGAFARQVKTSLTILRPSNVYGPGQPMQADFGIVRTLLEKARSGESLAIWGSGQQVRDFLYIDDLVEACARLIGMPSVSGTFNVGSGVGVSLLELVALARKITDRDISIQLHPERGIDVEGIYLDSRKLQGALGWQAATSLEDGMGKTWAWLTSQ